MLHKITQMIELMAAIEFRMATVQLARGKGRREMATEKGSRCREI